jgi:hypothetical protein
MADSSDKPAPPKRKIDVEALLQSFRENLADTSERRAAAPPALRKDTDALSQAFEDSKREDRDRRRMPDPFPFHDMSGSMGCPYDIQPHMELDERYFGKKMPPEMLAHESAHRHGSTDDLNKFKHKNLVFDEADIAAVVGLQKWMFSDILMTEEERLQLSCQNGTTLAEAFQSGTSTPTQTMKPITLRRGFTGVFP